MSTEVSKPKKVQGPIRWNAIIPFIIVSLLVYIYFLLFFDLHMKKAIEWAGYKALGAEVNVGEFKSSFLKGNVSIKKIELTDSKQPELNALELADIRFDVNWDALLRVKFVVEEIAVEGVQFKSKRSRPGKVAPPEPSDDGPGFVDQLQEKAMNKIDKEGENNILGDTAEFLKTGKFDAQLQNIQDQIVSKKLIADINSKWKTKQNEWNEKVKTLPTTEELNSFKERFGKIKFSNFSNLQELDASVKEANTLLKDVEARNKQVTDLKSQFDTDIKGLDSDYKSINDQIKKDIDTLKSRFKIPKIDAASFAKELFMGYLTPYMAKLDRYKKTAQKYLPPKYAKMLDGDKQTAKPADDTIQPLPRSEGVTYEFPVKNGYPLYWIQKVKVSSKSNAQADYGDVNGLISNITSNQRQIGLPTTAKIEGDFNKFNVNGIKLNAMFDNRAVDSIIKTDFIVGSYFLEGLKLFENKDGSISIPKTKVSLDSTINVVALKNFDIRLNNVFNEVNFDIKAADATLNEILQSTMGGIHSFDLEASAKGELKNLGIEIRSSLGRELEKGFSNLLQNKVKEANEKLQATINAEVGKLKAQLDDQVSALKNQTQGEIKKVQNQIDDQKKQIEAKIAQAKNDFENQANKAKKDAEDKAKKQVEDEAKKKADELKKRLGL
ncbi:MAG: hypothetical protein K0R29_1195 [Pseudobdellovibrio sp.]|jgi:uncharacterized protein (TIGR03545 family)|nr:hypothetical protein [Pseudobdellovibrio sp.]